MARGVRFTDREKNVLRHIMLSAWARKRGGSQTRGRFRLNPVRRGRR